MSKLPRKATQKCKLAKSGKNGHQDMEAMRQTDAYSNREIQNN